LLQNKRFLLIAALGAIMILGLFLVLGQKSKEVPPDERVSPISSLPSDAIVRSNPGISPNAEIRPSGASITTKIPSAETQHRTSDSKNSERADITLSGRHGAIAAVENSKLPSFFRELGTLGKKVWNELTSMAFDDVKRTAALVEVGDTADSPVGQPGDVAHEGKGRGAVGEPDPAATTQKADDSSPPGTRFVSWGCQKPCEAGAAPDGALDPKKPPALTGFVARVYDPHRNLLNTQAVRVRPDDPFGCGCYKVYLKDLLPPDVLPEAFRGWLALSTVTGTQKLESDAMWLNLDRPKDVTLSEQNDQMKPGSSGN